MRLNNTIGAVRFDFVDERHCAVETSSVHLERFKTFYTTLIFNIYVETPNVFYAQGGPRE